MRQLPALLFGTLLLAGCEPEPDAFNHPLSKSVKDDRLAFRIDPDKPWQIVLGRGSGSHGLDTITLNQDGQLVIYRRKSESQGNFIRLSWETATLKLPPESVTKVLEAVEKHQLLKLDREYHANAHDGTQWVLWIRQGDQEKAVYFNNHFPEQIVKFAKLMDKIVWANSDLNLKWEKVRDEEESKHQLELWESLKRQRN
jgi:hypothetical protein